MKKHCQITILTILFVILNPINLVNLINETNQLNHFNSSFLSQLNQLNQFNSIVCAQETKEPEPPPIQIFESYVIGQEDVLEVFVWRNDQLSREVVVRPDGKISLPLIQDLQAEGLTVLQLKDRITGEFKQYVQNPKVTVIVKQINSYKVSVLGRVVNPGVYPITGSTTLIEAISMAGGFTEWANRRKITVIRNEGDKKKKSRINYKKIISGKDPSQNITLQRGDTIVVP